MSEVKFIKGDDKVLNEVFYEIDTGGGGDCLFRSLSYVLYDTPTNHFKVRQRICKAPIPQELEPFYIKEEREKMCNLKEWGTHLEVMIAAKVYKRPIIVYKKGHNKGIGKLCESYHLIDDIKNKKIFKGVRKYLSGDYKKSTNRIYCIYLPDNNSNIDPIILYNIGNIHYRVLKSKKSIHFDSKVKSVRKTVKKSDRKSKRKTVRKSKRKTVRKSKRKSVRKTKRKSLKKSKRKSLKKSKRKSVRKTKRKSVRKTKRKTLKNKKIVRKSVRNSVRKTVRKSKRKSSKK